jgi:hypothetical protein
MSGCDLPAPLGPNSLGIATSALSQSATAAAGAISGQAKALSLPAIDFTSLALFPLYIGYAILVMIAILVMLFIGAKIIGYIPDLDWVSFIIRLTFMSLLITLVTIDGSYSTILKNMAMCSATTTYFIKVAMSLLAAITIMFWYIITYTFDQSEITDNYLLIMIHISLLASIMTLCLTTMQQLSLLGINKT